MARAVKIAGRYRIEGRLGVGGMSTVELALDERLERYVAVKLLAEHLADDPTFISRFRREALAAARLVHPNIVQTFDFGLDEATHQYFIVMEHVAGHSCAELLRDRGHLDVEQAVEIVTQACRGLDYAYRNGVVHRDVKPGNLLVSGTDVVKLADFGIARAADLSSITQVGSVLGTAAYLAPEQARGEEAGPRADLYSLGVVTYQLLSGRLPYEAKSLSELAYKQQRESPIPLSELNPLVAPELARAVAQAIAIEPEDRPADAMVLAKMLRDGARGIAPLGADAATAHLGTKATTRVLPRRGSDDSYHNPLPGQVDETAATRVVRQPPPPARQVPARDPRQPPRDQRGARAVRAAAEQELPEGRSSAARAARAAPRTPEPAPRSRGNRVLRRLFALMALMLVFIAAVVVAVVIATSKSPPAVQARTVIARDAQDAIDQVQSIINSYTK